MKKIVSAFLALVLGVSSVGLSVGAAQPAEETAQPQSENSEVSIPILENVGTVFEFLKSGLNDITVYLKPIEGTAVDEFYVTFTQNDGTVQDLSLGTYFDTKTGEVYGFNYEQGVFDSGFAYNAHSHTFYATNGCWQRQFGFTPLYDIAAPVIGYDYITRRIFFNYDGKEWMIQIWKGNYHWSLLLGAEIGIYNRPEGTVNGLFFDCAQDEEMMPISMKLYDSEKVYIDRPSNLTWWMTGFVLSGERHNPYKLTLESDFEFPNEEMAAAFVKSANLYPDITCTANGTAVALKW